MAIHAGSDKSTARSSRATRKFGPATKILNQLPVRFLRISDFSSPIVSVSLAAHVYTICQHASNTQKHLTHTRIPSEKSDKVLSVMRVMLANQRTGRRKSYIKAESVACQFCRQNVHANYWPSYSVCTHRKYTNSYMLTLYNYELFIINHSLSNIVNNYYKPSKRHTQI